MSPIEIRRMVAGDSERVGAIQATSLPNAAAGWAAPDFLRLESWVLLAGELVVAFLVGRRVAEDEFELLNMAVAEDQRRRGYGKALLLDALARYQGMWFLEVRASNEAAQALYEVLGFHRSGRRRDYYRSPTEDAVEMSKLS